MKTSAILVTAKLCLRLPVNPIKEIKKYLTKSSAILVTGKLCPRDSYRQRKINHKHTVKKLICFLGGALLVINVQAQYTGQEFYPLYIDGNLPDITIHKIINYKDSVAGFSAFQGTPKKLVILDLWNIHCSDCIAQFPKEDSLQKRYQNEVQFIMVTQDPEQKVKDFIARWEKLHHLKLQIPIITDDTVLTKKYVRVLYEPQFAWFDGWNRLIAQTNEYFLSAQNIESVLHAIQEQQSEVEKNISANNH